MENIYSVLYSYTAAMLLENYSWTEQSKDLSTLISE